MACLLRSLFLPRGEIRIFRLSKMKNLKENEVEDSFWSGNNMVGAQ
jgi:hypothetical protein